jgi:hypothetical protein
MREHRDAWIVAYTGGVVINAAFVVHDVDDLWGLGALIGAVVCALALGVRLGGSQ